MALDKWLLARLMASGTWLTWATAARASAISCSMAGIGVLQASAPRQRGKQVEARIEYCCADAIHEGELRGCLIWLKRVNIGTEVVTITPATGEQRAPLTPPSATHRWYYYYYYWGSSFERHTAGPGAADRRHKHTPMFMCVNRGAPE